MSKYVNLEELKGVIRQEWVKYMPTERDMSLAFVLGKISELPTIEVMEYPQVDGITPTLVKQEVSEDAISRKAVRDMLMDSWVDGYEYSGDLIGDADKLPSVIPSRPKGEWEEIIQANEFGETYVEGVVCSICGYESNLEHPFCPNCGSRNRKENVKHL